MKGHLDLSRERELPAIERDRFGLRPLRYCTRGSEVWFGTSVQELRELKAPLGQIDRGALSDYLELGYVPAPATLWSGVRKVPAGHRLRLDAGGVELEPWAETPLPGTSVKRPSRIAVRARLEQAVRRALGESSPPAALLWPGADSAALVGLMTRLAGRVRTFSFAFGADEDFELPRRIAHRFRAEHREIRLAPKPAEDLPQALSACGEPCGDARMVLLLAAFGALSGECKEVLTADGADELFAGHERYLRAARLPQMERTARAADLLRQVAPRRHRGRLQKAALALASSGAPRARALIEIFSGEERRALLGESARVATHGAGEHLLGADAAMAFDLSVALPDAVLFQLDAASTRAGIEARPAFLDAALARLVVPPLARHKLGRTHGNRLLRESVADLVPRDILSSKARRPEPRLLAWLQGPLRPMLHDLVRSPSARIRTLLDPRAIDHALVHALSGRGDARQAWLLFALELWAREQRG